MKSVRGQLNTASVPLAETDFSGKRDMIVQDVHAHSLAKATLLSGFQVARAIPPSDVIAVLQKASVSFVLVGAYGLGSPATGCNWRPTARLPISSSTVSSRGMSMKLETFRRADISGGLLR